MGCCLKRIQKEFLSAWALRNATQCYAGYLAAGGWAYQLQLAELRAVQGAQNAAASGTSVTSGASHGEAVRANGGNVLEM